MKKILLSIFSLVGITSIGYSQCSTSSAPFGNCNYGIQINAFSLAGVASTGNNGCGQSGYNSFTTPVRMLLVGQTYPYSASVGSGYYQMGFAIWIDLDGNGQYAASEMLVNSSMSTSHAGNLTIPGTATPGGARKMRVRASYYTNLTGNDACTNSIGYYCETEDYLVDIVSNTPCSGSPTANSVVTPTYQICPNSSAALGLSSSYFNSFGFTYQWQFSTVSNVGPWTNVPGGNSNTLATPNLTTSTYYSVIITCSNSPSSSITSSAGQVTVSNVVTSTVPYYEGFEGIAMTDQLPNCSWSLTSTQNCHTYTQTMNANRSSCNGSRYAAFYTYYVNGSSFFYTNQIQLYAGVTYSTGLNFHTENYGYTNVSTLAIMYGTSQTSTALTPITQLAPASSPVCKLMSGTFSVATSGLYYIAVKCTSNGSYGVENLSWDDLFVVAPCELNPFNLSVSASTNVVCSGNSINLTATGADTYTWNVGSNVASLTEYPNSNFMYVVVGTNTLTGCTNTTTQYVVVNNSPQVVVFANNAIVCAGQPVNLTAYGATNYTWSTGSFLSYITVNPTVTTTYNISGVNAFGCSTNASVAITVAASPSVSAASSAPDKMCAGETQTLTASGNGVVNFQWAANTLYIVSPVAVISPTTSTTYTLSGVNAQGCVGVATIFQSVDACTGLNEMTTSLSGVKVYPNPTAGFFTVELNSELNKTVELIDISGRLISSTTSKDGKVNMSVSHLSNGVYYVKIKSDNAVEVIKVVKQ